MLTLPTWNVAKRNERPKLCKITSLHTKAITYEWPSASEHLWIIYINGSRELRISRLKYGPHPDFVFPHFDLRT